MTEHVKERTAALLAAALQAALAHGWGKVTREQIAAQAGVSPALVSARLGTMDAMRRSVMRAAVRQRCLPVIAQGLVARNAHALAADAGLRQEAMEAACR